ncbi:MAG: hypothetical protein ACLF0P_01605 [Thermoanaerobaculia bacterium]
MSRQDTTRITRYLLGQLPPEEMDRTEEHLLAERDLFELAETVEDDLVDSYARGELPEDERRRFERRLLSSSRIQQRLEIARALAAHDRRRGTAGPPSRRERNAGRGAPRRVAVGLAWAATLAAMVAGGWFAFQSMQHQERIQALQAERAALAQRLEEEVARAARAEAAVEEAANDRQQIAEIEERLAEAQEEIAQLEERPTSSPERRVRTGSGDYGEASRTATLFLSLATRSDAGPATLRLDEAERAELQLDLEGQRDSGPLTATVLRNDVVVWRETGVPVESFGAEAMARLTVPEQLLREGRYRVELTAEPDGVVGAYELSVER